MKFQRKNTIVDATQWFKLGDHPNVTKYIIEEEPDKIVGWINTINGGNIVNIGDWIIRHPTGAYTSCDLEKFQKQYTRIE